MNKYVKIVYQTEPIGEEKIILYLTTFDLEAFEKDKLKESEKVIEVSLLRNQIKEPDYIQYITSVMENYVRCYLEPYVVEMKEIIERKKIENKRVENITNSGDVNCNVVWGDIKNCDNVYCTEIKGNVINCDKIIYK